MGSSTVGTIVASVLTPEERAERINAFLAAAAATGAKVAVTESLSAAARGKAALPRAAAQGAVNGIAEQEHLIRPHLSALLFDTELAKVKAAAAAGTAAAVSAMQMMLDIGDEEVSSANHIRIVSAAVLGAQAGCASVSLTAEVQSVNTRSGSYLRPLLGAILPIAFGTGLHLAGTKASELAISSIYGALAVLLFTLMTGIIPIVRSFSAESVSRHATLYSFVMIVSIMTIAWCSLLSDRLYINLCRGIGLLVVICLSLFWSYSGY
uniref:Uncharacterized protein n=1 Tax=Oryza punctata TaxID=4537 RepID=A0A0E0LHJ5_ORYPU